MLKCGTLSLKPSPRNHLYATFTSISLIVCLMLLMPNMNWIIAIFINTTGSILGRPVSVEYFSSTRSYMNEKSTYLCFLIAWIVLSNQSLKFLSFFLMILYHKYHLKCWNFNDFIKNMHIKGHEHHTTFMAFVYSLRPV